jgi:4-hydroxyphenylpyruvate dioxygenase
LNSGQRKKARIQAIYEATKMVCKLGIPTASLGHVTAGHTLETRLDVAKQFSYQGVEIFYPDIVALAKGDSDADPSQSSLLSAAYQARTMCEDRGIEIICLSSFLDYEGQLDRTVHQTKFKEFQLWLSVARQLKTEMIMMPASSLPADQLGGRALIVQDLQQAADEAAKFSIRIAYEARCSATLIDRWEYSWDVIKAIDRANFGMCLDAVHIAGRIFADPSTPSCRIPDSDTAVSVSLRRLQKLVKPEKERIFLVQIGDARPPDEPVSPGSFEYDVTKSARMVWSQKYRLFYGEVTRGGFLPMERIMDAILNGVEYEGWVSLEIFSARLDCWETGVPMEMARRGAVSWGKLADDMGWWPRGMKQ